MRYHWVLALGLAVAAVGCASTYVPPRERAPEAWYGGGGLMAAPGTVSLADGEVSVGETILSYHLTPARQGRLAQAVTYEGAYGGDITLPAGTPMISQQYSLVTQTTYGYVPTGPQINQNAGNDPIEWCVADMAVESVCAFWEAPDRARYVSVFRSSARIMRPFSTAGMAGPVPVIEEGEVDFGGPVIQRFLLESVDAEGLKIRSVLQDGTVFQEQWSRNLRWTEQRNASTILEGAPLIFEPVGDPITAVRVSVRGLIAPVAPPAPTTPPPPKPADAVATETAPSPSTP